MERFTPLDLVLTMMLAYWKLSPRQPRGPTTTLTVQKRYILAVCSSYVPLDFGSDGCVCAFTDSRILC